MMRFFSCFLSACCVLLAVSLSGQVTLDYYLKSGVRYAPEVPAPAEWLGYQVGERHVSHDQLLGYMRELARLSPRVRLETYGYSHEKRPLICLTITSPENHTRIEGLRALRRQLADPAQPLPSGAPAVVYMGYSIHGNEASGSNAALAVAYYLAAAQDEELDAWLRDMVILLDPCFNPDGLQRFSSWVNSRQSLHGSHDGADDEFNEPWPGGRSNHYWFDLNRDWLAATQPESTGRVRMLQSWKPNILTDHHEMGGNATFFFQPGVPSRVNPLTPPRNQALTAEIGRFHAEALSEKGVLFYSRENFDDHYYGKGSTYPDVNGAVGILFEQASSRGSAQQTSNGLLTFPYTVRNQCLTSFSTLRAAHAMRADLNAWLREFYASALQEAAAHDTQAWVFGDGGRGDIPLQEFLVMLLLHGIEVHRLGAPLKQGGGDFPAGSYYIVPAQQLQYRLVRGIFDRPTVFSDSIFYDISAWTMPDAYGLHWTSLDKRAFRAALLGEAVQGLSRVSDFPPIAWQGASLYAMILSAEAYNLPRAVSALHRRGVLLKVATKPFVHQGVRYRQGSVLIPMGIQSLSAEQIYGILQQSGAAGVTCALALHGQSDDGPDLGSDAFVRLQAPRVAMLTGSGVNNLSAGEMWHLLDTRYAMPVVKLDISRLASVDLSKYNVLLMPEGAYGPALSPDKIRNFVQGGGVLVGVGNACNWLRSHGLLEASPKTPEKETPAGRRPYAAADADRRAKQMPGAIFEAELDLTHPLCYGYERDRLPVFYSEALFIETPGQSYNTPAVLSATPRLAGYVPAPWLRVAPGSAVVQAQASGRGRVIAFTANPNFRGFWYGGNRLFANAMLWGHIIRD